MDFTVSNKSDKKASEKKYGAPCLNGKCIHCIKPLLMHQAFSWRGLGKAPKVSSDSEDLTFEAAPGPAGIMEEMFTQFTESGSNPTAQQYLPTLSNSPIGRSAYTNPLGKESAAQLTIFYNGRVNVYDVFEKQAEAIIQFAGNKLNSEQLHSEGFDSGTSFKPITMSSKSTGNHTEAPLLLNLSKNSAPQLLHLEKLHMDLPLQRKRSLQRFLLNRKEYRMNRAAPYSHPQDEDNKVRPQRRSICNRQSPPPNAKDLAAWIMKY